MNVKFDYYRHLESAEMYLCNPNGTELFPVVGYNRKLTLRFNDLSELSFLCYGTITHRDGAQKATPYYGHLETRRLIFSPQLGWFLITSVTEEDNGIEKYKEVSCKSLQAVFRDIGFSSEERVYALYNKQDLLDASYDLNDESAIPSVVGQLYQQLGIEVEPDVYEELGAATYNNSPTNYKGVFSATETYSYGNVVMLDNVAYRHMAGTSTTDVDPSDTTVWEKTITPWRIVYVSSYYDSDSDSPEHPTSDVYRTLEASDTYGYNWIVDEVSEAFGVFFVFDFLNKTISIKAPCEVAQSSGVIFTFSNFMQSIKIEEDAENIVTVMRCNGDNCDISSVNPTGTNYVCDFTYYEDANGRWMTSPLKAELVQWKGFVDGARGTYVDKIVRYRELCQQSADVKATLKAIDLICKDLTAAAEGSTASGIVWAETVEVGSTSYDSNSMFYGTPFSGDDTLTFYADTGFSEGLSTSAKIAYDTIASGDEGSSAKLYFKDVQGSAINTFDGYCLLYGKTIKNAEGGLIPTLGGFKRYVLYESSDFTQINAWLSLYESKKEFLVNQRRILDDNIDRLANELSAIANQLHIIKFFAANAPDLLQELRCYWIEGEYENGHIAVTDSTSSADETKLELELLACGESELAKVCKPKVQFSLASVDCTKLYEFREQAERLELGKTIEVEKEDGNWYSPILLEVSYDLDNPDSFDLRFATQLKLDDFGYTYGDLMVNGGGSRSISASNGPLTAKMKARLAQLEESVADLVDKL